jgi:Asp-tRNA(Asn)/Glu-tRNA(Gln) amidotransferase A subunit family amidase
MQAKPVAAPWLTNAERIRRGEDDPVSFLERCLGEIDRREKDVLAFVCTNLEQARTDAAASARRWREGTPLSPIDGMPIGVKDVIETRDMPTGMGSPLYDGWQSQRDSASVRALREAGAVIVGKTVTTEFAASEPGPTRNPWDIARTPGGSSSGSAAGVAAGYFSAGLGTQVIGSILRPASYCGVIGYKPTFGAVNRGGSHDYMSQSSQGVIAATLADAWQVAREIVDRAGGDPGHPGLDGPPHVPQAIKPQALVFLETGGWKDACDAAKTAVLDARRHLEKSGIEVLDRNTSIEVANVESLIEQSLAISFRINAWESRWPLNTYRDRDATKLSAAMLNRAAEAETMTLDDYREALRTRAAACEAYEKLASLAQGCISLSAAGCAPVGLRSTGNAAFVVTGSMLRIPTISIPVLSDEDLPLGMQVLGFQNGDAQTFAVAGGLMDIMLGGARA